MSSEGMKDDGGERKEWTTRQSKPPRERCRESDSRLGDAASAWTLEVHRSQVQVQVHVGPRPCTGEHRVWAVRCGGGSGGQLGLAVR